MIDAVMIVYFDGRESPAAEPSPAFGEVEESLFRVRPASAVTRQRVAAISPAALELLSLLVSPS